MEEKSIVLSIPKQRVECQSHWATQSPGQELRMTQRMVQTGDNLHTQNFLQLTLKNIFSGTITPFDKSSQDIAKHLKELGL